MKIISLETSLKIVNSYLKINTPKMKQTFYCMDEATGLHLQIYNLPDGICTH